ncbi:MULTISPECIES: hypothetical protein [Rhodococcus]|uniref:Uncharacterized protein n=1 Tax=Rhodococcus erythropolis TaxID=1833 RepID=A0A0E4AEQ2_RHOER|nr:MULTISPECIES: hypothetical protein [Rhodococcus]AKE01342.1 hypothetical protein XU06_30965 [Rhodococcus erythropolis]MBH5143705.1 hypothetical protein [Rhodococcus erythropolis]MBO8150460.1 hypothetical protein [Rhodococcus erythropolis]MDO1492658.1 hypothetical protein [Rhodococcus erythropolis]MDV8015654.1 hypothetical protein [Rhodococcus sp. IEGM 1241]
MNTTPNTPDFDALDAAIKAEAEEKMKIIRVVAAAHKELLDTREEFARKDAANVGNLDAAISEALRVGFTEASIKQWRVPAARKSAAKRTATKKPVTKKIETSPAASPAAESGEQKSA